MAIIGWLIVTGLACVIGVAGLLMLAFQGKFDLENVVPLLISGGLFYGSYSSFPFSVTVL